jgi:hypothetical protein
MLMGMASGGPKREEPPDRLRVAPAQVRQGLLFKHLVDDRAAMTRLEAQ